MKPARESPLLARNIYLKSDRPPPKTAARSITVARGEVNCDAYLVLFSEMVSYCRDRVTSVEGLEKKLSQLGYRMGARLLELVAAREKHTKREIRHLNMLQFIYSSFWRFLFGKEADSLKKVSHSETKYYIEEAKPLVNRYVSVPKDYGQLNCAAFIAGIIHGVLDSAGFPAEVKAYSKETVAQKYPPRTIYYIEFAPEVLQRERRLGS